MEEAVGVIVSTLLIDQFGWTGFDPLASMLIAALIFMSVVPLIKHSAAVLMLSISDDLEYHITEGLHKVYYLFFALCCDQVCHENSIAFLQLYVN